jgi:23S rRNA (uracil1939-C5)-methyltransferase
MYQETFQGAGGGEPRSQSTRLPRHGDRLEVRIERLDDKGLGLGVVSAGTEGECLVRVRGGLPGAWYGVSVVARRRRLVDAKVVEVLEASPDTAPSRCPHFGPNGGPCGGCTFQHLVYEAQLAAKRQRVAEALAPLLGTHIAVEPVVGMAHPWHYRNKLDFTFGARRYRAEGEDPERDATFALGLHVPGMWSKVLDVDRCAIAFEGADTLLGTVRRLSRAAGLLPWDTRQHTGLLRHVVLRRGVRTGETMLVLVTSERAAELVDPLVQGVLAAHPELTTIVQDVNARHATIAIGQEQFVLHGPGTIDEVLLGRRFTLSPHSFFQTNTLQAERLFELLREEARLAPAGVVFDLYCGAGTIGLCLADLAGQVVGFESVGAAVADARANAARNGLAGATFVEGDVLESLAAFTAANVHARPDVVVLDPPRAGLHRKVVPTVLALGAQRIVYVSCNPESAARDLAALTEGGYVVERVRPVDLFPHTPHIETVISLRRGDEAPGPQPNDRSQVTDMTGPEA